MQTARPNPFTHAALQELPARFAPNDACPGAVAFKSTSTDAELMLRAADDLEATADMICSCIAGTRLLRSQAVALRKLARKR